jgi:hypothetical protein
MDAEKPDELKVLEEGFLEVVESQNYQGLVAGVVSFETPVSLDLC